MKHQLTLIPFFSVFTLTLLSTLFILPPTPILLAQNQQETIVTGTLVDKQNKEPLPFANVYFTNTTVGTTTDFEGKFTINTKDLSINSITVSFIGYKEKQVKIKAGETNTVEIGLKSEAQRLETFVLRRKRKVPKDTLAIRLYRRVVKNKSRNKPVNYTSYQYEQYNKMEIDLFNFKEKLTKRKLLKPFDFAFENIDTTEEGKPFLPILIREKLADVYYTQDPKQEKELIKATQVSGIENVSVTEIADLMLTDVPIYDNLINLGGKGFVSPFANNALPRYRYFLTDSTYLDNEWCYKLEFVARRKQDLAFVGHAWIHDETAAIKEIELKILDKINLNFVSDLKVKQSFTYYKDSLWFKDQERMTVNFNATKNKKKMSLRLVNSISRDQIVLNQPIAEQFFKGESSEIISEASGRDQAYWLSHRHSNLTTSEKAIYTTVDSIKKSSAFKKYNAALRFIGAAKVRLGPVDIGRFYKFYSWNDIEGSRIRFGGHTNVDNFSKKLQITGYAAYGLKDQRWKYHGGFRLHLNRYNNRWHMLGGDYTYDLRNLNQIGNLYTHDNLYLSLLRNGSADGLLFERRANVFYEKEWIKGLNTKFSVLHRIVYAKPGFYDFQYLGSNPEIGASREAVPDISTTEFNVNLIWGRDQKFIEYPFERYPLTFFRPTIHLDYTAGISGVLKVKDMYHKLQIGVQQKVPNRLGFTKYNLVLGKVFGTTPYPFLEIHRGNETIIYDKLAFNLMNDFEFVSDEYAYIWFDHHFDGLIFNALPLIKKLKLRSVVSAKTLVGRVSEDNLNFIALPGQLSAIDDRVYAEASVGIENIARMFRVDMIWRLTQRDQPDVHNWGLRGSFKLNF